jgi:23S rRNA (cytidine1920-2'-O)/16S rRNA (cytidine1409-2'-O)-methyltransferase
VTRKARLDQLVVERGLAESRARAQALVLAGRVLVNGARVDKAGSLVAESAEITLRGEVMPYVSRGGVKLAGAIDGFSVPVAGLRCLDVGASTGGFTDCLLQRGAKSVAAVDVGYGQLASKLRSDPRVLVRERTNARNLVPEVIGGEVDLTVVDASFIGLGKQFEVGREEASKTKGVVRDPALRAKAIERVASEIRDAGFRVLGERDSTLPGPSGNVEAFVWAERV